MTTIHHPACAPFLHRECDSTLISDVNDALVKLKERRNGLGFRFLRQVEINIDDDMLAGIRSLEALLQQLLHASVSE